MKQCTKCKSAKELKEFNTDLSKKDLKQTQCRACKNQAQKNDYLEKKEIYLERQRTRRAYDPRKQKAYNAVYKAIKKGEIKRPKECSVCQNSKARIEAHHHKGYDKEFQTDIIFLCTSCHRQADMILNHLSPNEPPTHHPVI